MITDIEYTHQRSAQSNHAFAMSSRHRQLRALDIEGQEAKGKQSFRVWPSLPIVSVKGTWNDEPYSKAKGRADQDEAQHTVIQLQLQSLGLSLQLTQGQWGNRELG